MSLPPEPQPLLMPSTAPLGAVLLCVLALWMAAIPTALHTVSVDIGICGGGPEQDAVAVHRVDIDFDGSLSWDGQALATRAAMDDRMRTAAAAGAEVQVKPHRLADYAAFAAVMASAQRNGVTRMGLIGESATLPIRYCQRCLSE